MPTERLRYVIVGGGFCGTMVAKLLLQARADRDRYTVTLVEPRRAFEFTPGIHRIVCEPARAASMQITFHELLPGIEHRTERAEAITTSHVRTPTDTIPYDRVVIATGASAPVRLPEPGASSVASLYSLADARALARRIKQAGISHALVIGGGLTGVELAGELATKWHGRVTLVHAGPRLLEQLPDRTGRAGRLARRFLTKRDVRVVCGERVVNVSVRGDSDRNGDRGSDRTTSGVSTDAGTDTGTAAGTDAGTDVGSDAGPGSGRGDENSPPPMIVRTDTGRTLSPDITIWCAGILPAPPPMEGFRGIGPMSDDRGPVHRDAPAGGLPVRSTLQLVGYPRVFIGGDCARIAGGPFGFDDDRSEPKTAQNAEAHARVIASNLRRLARDDDGQLVSYRPPLHGRAMVVSLGEHYGLITVYGMTVGGVFPGHLKPLVRWWVLHSYRSPLGLDMLTPGS